jgi:hypothetical protein
LVTEPRKRLLVVWIVVCSALAVVGVLMCGASRSSVLNPPQCPDHATKMPDGSRCIIGANIGAGIAGLTGIALAAAGGLGLVASPVAALVLRHRAGSHAHGLVGDPADQLVAGGPPQTAWGGGPPDWAGRRPYGPPGAPCPTSGTDPVCLVSMITGIGAVGSLLLCAFFSVPLAIVAVITGGFGLTGPSGQGSSDRRQAVAGISCGSAALVVVTLFLIWFRIGA